MNKQQLLKLIVQLKNSTVRTQQYELASNIRDLEKEILELSEIDDSHVSRYNEFVFGLTDEDIEKTSPVGEILTIGDDALEGFRGLIKDVEILRKEGKKILKNAGEMESNAWDVIRKHLPEQYRDKKNIGISFLPQSGKFMISDYQE